MSISEDLIQEALDASKAVYSPNKNVGPPGGFTILTNSTLAALDANDVSDGFFAQAYVNSQSHIIIIAYEGSLFDLSTYGRGTEEADAALAIGQRPAALDHAVTFATDVETAATAAQLGGYTIYVTGHSLGGTEAEAAALALNNSVPGGFIAGMLTFAATGLPGYLSPGGNNNFINFVDYGDPIGNYARDSVSELSLISATGSHFGSVDLIGPSWHAAFIDAALAVATVSGVDALPDFLLLLGGGAYLYHPLPNYASDLGLTAHDPVNAQGTPVPLPSQQTSDPNTDFIISQAGTSTSPPVNNNPHPVVLVHPSQPVNTNSNIPLATLFTANEASGAPADHIDHYSAFIVRGSGSLAVNGQTYGLGSTATDISPAGFATATFSAGPNAGVTEVAVIAFDNLGNSSIAGDTTITVIAPAPSPQSIVPTDHTPPTVLPPSQQLVTGVGSNPDLTSNFLQVTDANSANYTPSQLVYTITSAPSDGYLLKGGSIVSSFTQADINNRLVEYQENGTVASSDSFSYFVSDPAGNRSAPATFNITINAPPTATHPVLDTDTALSVGQGQTALITSTNLHVTDSGLNSWQIIYTVTGGAAHGQILADGINVVHTFTQQQVDLGLISYQNTGNVSGPDNLTFTVSDNVGGTIGQSTFGINVIPKNNLTVDVERPLFTNPQGTWWIHSSSDGGFPLQGNSAFSSFTTTPGYETVLSSDILSASDPGVDPSNIVYTVQSLPANAAGIVLGQWTAPIFAGGATLDGTDFGPVDIADNFPHSFTQAQVNAGQVFYRQLDMIASGQEHLGEQFSIVMSVSDNAGNSLPNVVLPVVLEPNGLLTDGSFIPAGQIPAVTLTAPINGTTTIGNGLLTYISPQFSDPQITYSVWFVPTHGALLLNGVALAKNGNFTQQDIDQGRLAYSEDGSAVATDSFGLFVTDPNLPGAPEMVMSVNVNLTGAEGGQAFTGHSGAELLAGGIGNNYFFGDGSTSVSYANSPNGVSIDLGQGKVSNGYGGTDTLTNIHSVTGSAYADTITGDAANDIFSGGPGNDVMDGGLGYDIAVYSSNRSDYAVTRSGLTTTVSGPDGTDTLKSVELLQFSDGTMPLAPAAADFHGVGTSDVLIRNSVTGDFADGQISNGQVSSWLTFENAGSNWQTSALADFNGDGKADMLLFNSTNGNVAVWEMNGASVAVDAGVANLGMNWKPVGTGDFNGDGNADILLANPTNGNLAVWEMNGTTIAVDAGIANIGTNWKTLGTGDFNGDGKSDLLLFNPTNGNVALWEMNGTAIAVDAGVGNIGTSWKAIGTGDFNGDGKSDILLFNPGNGNVAVWEMNGASIAVDAGIGNAGPNMTPIGTGDYNGDGKSDILFQKTDGTPVVWVMNGTTVTAKETLNDPGQNWHATTG